MQPFFIPRHNFGILCPAWPRIAVEARGPNESLFLTTSFGYRVSAHSRRHACSHGTKWWDFCPGANLENQ